MKFRKAAVMLGCLALCLSVSLPALAAEDVPSPWAGQSVGEAIGAGLVPESLQGEYAQPITRAEFCALAVQTCEKEFGPVNGYGGVPMSDCSDTNVQKMAWLGVVQGVGQDRYLPDALLTREQAAVILARLCGRLEHPLEQAAPKFADRDTVSDWAKTAVGQMEESGLMRGTGENRFSPQGAYTREQSIVTLLRVAQLLEQ